MARARPFYETDLAAVHDADFGFTADAAAGVLVRELARRFPSGGTVVDLGCGSGILSRHVTDAGYRALGIDVSRAMLALARRHAPAARFRVGSLLDADLPPCVGAAAIGEAVNYTQAAGGGRGSAGRALRRVFTRIHAALEPGRVFLFDVAGPGRAGPAGRRELFHDRAGWSMHVVVEERDGVLTREMALFRRHGAGYRRSDERHVLYLHHPSDVERALRRAGFRVRRLRRYGDLQLPAGLHGLLATKPF